MINILVIPKDSQELWEKFVNFVCELIALANSFGDVQFALIILPISAKLSSIKATVLAKT